MWGDLQVEINTVDRKSRGGFGCTVEEGMDNEGVGGVEKIMGSAESTEGHTRPTTILENT